MKLADIVSNSSLGVELLSGSGEADQDVQGAHVFELENPSRWVPPDWIVLTTGIRLRGRAAVQRSLITDLADGGAMALGFGVGFVFDSVPRAILEEARVRDFPVFSVPRNTPFRHIVRMVDTDLLSRDLRTVRLSESITDGLVRAVGEAEPQAALIDSLARLLKCDVSLHRPNGTVVAASGGLLEAANRWEAVRRSAASGLPSQITGSDGLFAVAIEAGGTLTAWIALSVSPASPAVPLILRALSLASHLLAALVAIPTLENQAQRSARQRLLNDLFADSTVTSQGDAMGELSGRALSLGFDLAQDNRVVAVLLEREETSPVAEIESLLDRARTGYALAVDGQHLTLLIPEHAELRHLLDDIRAVCGHRPVGVSRAVSDVSGVRAARREALLALTHARAAPSEESAVVFCDELGITAWLVSQVGIDAAAERAAETLKPLLGQELLLETLSAYMRANLNVQAAAVALQVHENTVRHRLGKIRGLVGRDLNSPAWIADAYLSLLLHADRLEFGKG